MMSCMALVMIMTRAMQLIMKGTFNRAALLGVRHWHALADARPAGTALVLRALPELWRDAVRGGDAETHSPS